MSEGYLEYLNSHVNDRFPLYKKSSNYIMVHVNTLNGHR